LCTEKKESKDRRVVRFGKKTLEHRDRALILREQQGKSTTVFIT
jgi:hypothetical protein